MKKIVVLLGMFLSLNAFAQSSAPSEKMAKNQDQHSNSSGKKVRTVTFTVTLTVLESEEEEPMPALIPDLKLSVLNHDDEATITYADMIHGKPIANLGNFQVMINPYVVDRKVFPSPVDNTDPIHE